jgi:hypothetical protein
MPWQHPIVVSTLSGIPIGYIFIRSIPKRVKIELLSVKIVK